MFLPKFSILEEILSFLSLIFNISNVFTDVYVLNAIVEVTFMNHDGAQ